MKHVFLVLALLIPGCAPSRFTGTLGWSIKTTDWERISNSIRSSGQLEGVTWKDKAGKTALMVEVVNATPAEAVMGFYMAVLEKAEFAVSDVSKLNSWLKGASHIDAMNGSISVRITVLDGGEYTYIIHCRGSMDYLGTDPCEPLVRSFQAK